MTSKTAIAGVIAGVRGLVWVVSISLCMTWLSSGSARAEEEWTWRLAPYLWATDITGDVEARGTEAEVSAGFGDLLELLNFGLMGLVEGRRGRWIVASELYGAELGDEFDTGSRSLGLGGATVTVGPGDIEVTSQLAFLDMRLGYTLLQQGSGSPVTLDLLAGARAWYTSIDVDVELPASASGTVLAGDRLPGFILSGVEFQPGESPDGIDRDFEESKQWLDPVIGLRTSYELRPGVSLTLVGDVGGFGIGSASDLSWNAIATLNYPLSARWMLRAGYRALNLDRDSGVKVDLTLHGPIVGVSYTFGD